MAPLTAREGLRVLRKSGQPAPGHAALDAAACEQNDLVSPPEAPEGARFAGVGSLVEVSFCPFPLSPVRIKSEAQIVGFAMNRSFEDAHSDTLFKSWRHRRPLTNSLFDTGQMRRTFVFRRRIVEELLASP